MFTDVMGSRFARGVLVVQFSQPYKSWGVQWRLVPQRISQSIDFAFCRFGRMKSEKVLSFGFSWHLPRASL